MAQNEKPYTWQHLFSDLQWRINGSKETLSTFTGYWEWWVAVSLIPPMKYCIFFLSSFNIKVFWKLIILIFTDRHIIATCTYLSYTHPHSPFPNMNIWYPIDLKFRCWWQCQWFQRGLFIFIECWAVMKFYRGSVT